MLSEFPAVVGVLAATYVFLLALLRGTQDAKEPPSVKDIVPFVSPILSMVSRGSEFHRWMRDKYNLPIYTLRLPGSRLYVVNSLPLATLIQNQYKSLSFAALVATVASNIVGVSKATSEVIERNLTSKEGYLMGFHKYVYSSLSPGTALDSMNRRAVQVIAESLDRQAKEGEKTVQLFQWARHELLMATTEGVYGPKNPFRDPEMEKAWKKSFQAREYMVKVWEKYFETNSHEQGSELIKARFTINHDYELPQPVKATARMEIGGTLAILVNTLPGAFWLVFHIFSDPAVFNEVRDELLEGVREDEDGSRTIDLSHVKSSCPILASTFKETMRVHSSPNITRIAMEDHRLDAGYLLKKGGTVIMPAKMQHTERSLWGDTVDQFNHRRFLKDPGTKRVSPAAFRGFGAGITLCPGRHFAATEILMFAALLVLRFDVELVDGDWREPSTVKSSMSSAMPVPDWDITVKIHAKDDKPWNVSFSGYDGEMEIAAEDMEGATPA